MTLTRTPGIQTAAHGPMAVAALACLCLGACVGGGAGQGGKAAPAARPGVYQASVKGDAFLGEVRAAGPGKALTAAGAVPVLGHAVTVRNATQFTPIGPDAGAAAKRGARALCAEAGGRFNEQAIGRHDGAGAWVFAGACA